MTRNVHQDGDALLAGELNTILNGVEREGVRNGLVASKGTGDWDVDITAGDIELDTDVVSLTADTVTLTDPTADPDLDSGEFRVDLITADSGGFTVSEGVAGIEPNAEDIPSGDVLIALVIIDADAAALTNADIRDGRTIITEQPQVDALAFAEGFAPGFSG